MARRKRRLGGLSGSPEEHLAAYRTSVAKAMDDFSVTEHLGGSNCTTAISAYGTANRALGEVLVHYPAAKAAGLTTDKDAEKYRLMMNEWQAAEKKLKAGCVTPPKPRDLWAPLDLGRAPSRRRKARR